MVSGAHTSSFSVAALLRQAHERFLLHGQSRDQRHEGSPTWIVK
jgi:hypothetical protein